MRGGEVSAYVCVCVVVYNQCLWNGGGSKSVSLQCSFPGINFQQRPCRASVGTGEPKKIRLRLFRRVAAFFNSTATLSVHSDLDHQFSFAEP